MKRMTINPNNPNCTGMYPEQYGFVAKDNVLSNVDILKVANRLGKYEDTGLEPEEIKPQRGWIPISDQMPGDERLKCWVTIQNVDRKIPFTVSLYWVYDHWQWGNGMKLSDRFEVSAWKREKVPVPFYPEESNNEEGK